VLWSSPNLLQEVTDALYSACEKSASRPKRTVTRHNHWSRWHTFLQEKDSKTLWKAIGWNGSFDKACNTSQRPSDADFAEHFSELLNSENNVFLTIPPSGVYIPLLDDDIAPGEVMDQIKKLKASKSAGQDGIPPGVLKYLSDEWLLLLTFILNSVFSGFYPSAWCLTRTIVLHKKGDTADVNNYRGISISNAISKVYDGILNHRFSTWYKPCLEQAGSQVGRGCEEQLIALRLYMDVARKTKQTLYILFVDYIKAYDRVNRVLLLEKLSKSGCGDKFLRALGLGLQNNFGVIGQEKFP
jgi:hypothetical protein